MRTGLLADQTSNFEAPHLKAFVNNTVAAGRATILAEQFVDATTQTHPANIDATPPGQVRVTTRSGQFEHWAQQLNRVLLYQLPN
jgi:hypothetical protein